MTHLMIFLTCVAFAATTTAIAANKVPQDEPRSKTDVRVLALVPSTDPQFSPGLSSKNWSRTMSPESWSSPGELLTGDGYADVISDFQVDSHGTPWLIWRRKLQWSSFPATIYWSTWTGSGWTTPERINPSDDSVVYKPKLAFAPLDTAWVVWHTQKDHDIWFMKGYSGSWCCAAPVNPPSGTMDYYSPEISVGGGQIWVTWYGAVGSDPYNVFVTQWNGQGWGPPTNITAGFPGYHWFADVAVDANGDPHVVWGDYYSSRIYYVTRWQGHWSSPVSINDPLTIAGGVWPAPQIVAGAGGLLHVVWVGRKFVPGVGYGDQDIFYSRFNGSGWATPIQVNADDLTDEFYPVIAVRDSTTMWVAWDNDEISGPFGTTAWVTELNGTASLGQTRLDAGYFFYNETPRLSLTPVGLPWAAWQGISGDFSDSGLFYSYFAPTTSVRLWDLTFNRRGDGVELQWSADPSEFIRFEIERASSEFGNFEVIGSVQSTAGGAYTWLDKPSSPAEYWYRVAAITRTGHWELLGPIAITWNQLVRLALSVKNPTRDDMAEVRVGVPLQGKVKFELWDVHGRLVARLGEKDLAQGWQDLRLPMQSVDGRLARGMYFLAVRGFGHVASVRLLILP